MRKRSLYSFADYSPEWPREFAQEERRLRALLGDELLAVHHVGSTSVPGLAAKPVIDVLPVVRDIQRIDVYTDAMEAAGYLAWGEYGLPGRRFFTKDRADHRTHNVHIYEQGNPEIDRHRAFCEYLRRHDDARCDYAERKRHAYAIHPANIEAYGAGKDDWIKRMEPVALAWWRANHLS